MGYACGGKGSSDSLLFFFLLLIILFGGGNFCKNQDELLFFFLLLVILFPSFGGGKAVWCRRIRLTGAEHESSAPAF